MRVLPLNPPSPTPGDARPPPATSRPSVEASEFGVRLRAALATPTNRAESRPSGTVATRHTSLSGTQAARALESAFEQSQGQPPSEATIAVLTAHWAHETGRGQAMLNFNFGGIKGRSPEGLTARYTTHEGHGASRSRISDGFRAYTSATSGASDYISLLKRRYPAALRAATQGDPKQFVRALHEGGYFTAHPGQYERSIRSLTRTALTQGVAALSAPGTIEARESLSGPPAPGQTPAHPMSVEHALVPAVWEESHWAETAFGRNRVSVSEDWLKQGGRDQGSITPREAYNAYAADSASTPVLEVWNQQLAADAVERAMAQLLARNDDR